MSREAQSTPNLTPQHGIVIYPAARGENPNVWRGQDDMVRVPSVFPRFMTPWNQVQLSNGWDGTNYGARDTSAAASYLSGIVPFQPGQTRMYGSNIGDYPQQGMAYPQWQAYVQSTAGAQPQYTGGVGTVNAPMFNPGSGA